MPVIPADLFDYFAGKKLSPYHAREVELYDELRIHANGEVPEKLINERRPSEPADVWEYRKKQYKNIPITKGTFGKVTTTLSKIRRSPDWSIDYSKAAKPNGVAKGKEMEVYCEKEFPEFVSVDNWAFSVLLQNYEVDANGVVLVLPIDFPEEENEYYEPFAYIFNSPKVKHFTKDLLVIETEETHEKEGWYGKIFWVVTPTDYTVWTETESGTYRSGLNWQHNLGYIPARKLKGKQLKTNGKHTLYESRLAAMVPNLNSAAIDSNELEAAKVMHLFPERWEYQSQPCQKCWDNIANRSLGYIITKGQGGEPDYRISCVTCGGSGLSGKTGPFSKIIVKKPEMEIGQTTPTTVPIPPAGYIEKNTAIEALIYEWVQNSLYNSLSSINYEFLSQSPLQQSGIAKAWDSEAANEFTYQIAEDLVNIMDWVYLQIANIRYGLLVPDEDVRKNMCPKIAVPQRFDLASSTYIIETLKSAREAKVSPQIIGQLEKQLMATVCYNSPEEKLKYELIIKLDPLANYTVDDKIAISADGVTTKVDYIISTNIVSFVGRALMEDEKFATDDYDKQRAVLVEYANEIITANDIVPTVLGQSETVIKSIQSDAGGSATPAPADATM